MIETEGKTPTVQAQGISPDVDLERVFWLDQRKALLDQVDSIERRLRLNPTTAQLRNWAKQNRKLLAGNAQNG